MKRLNHNHHLSLYFIVIIAIFSGIMAYVRLQNSSQLRHNFYRQWYKDYVVKVNQQESFIDTTPKTETRTALSEGQGYGMYIAVLSAKRKWSKKEYFDQLNNFYLKHRETINKDKTALMSWRAVENNGHWTINKNSATDGDLFIAQALLLASKQWHDDKYQKEAHAILQDILRYEYNPDTETLTVGDWADSKSKYYNLMRTSDVMPEFFDNFYQETGDKRWLVIKNTMLKRLNQLSHQNKTGLVPDFAWVSKNDVQPVKPKTISTENDGYYSANACRVPMMLAGCNDRSAQNTLKRMLKFFSKQNTITAGYTLKGKPLNKYQSASFSAPIRISCSESWTRDILTDWCRAIKYPPIAPEQLIRIGCTVLALWRLGGYGLEYACGALTLGMLASEVFSFLALLLLMLSGLPRGAGRCRTPMLPQLLRITVPLSLSSYARSALSTTQHLLVPRGLRLHGGGVEAALAAYGVIQGMSLPVLLFPA